MKKEYTIKEIFDPSAKSAEEKLNEVFIIYLTEKLVNSADTNKVQP